MFRFYYGTDAQLTANGRWLASVADIKIECMNDESKVEERMND